jgi:hypothetical protein
LTVVLRLALVLSFVCNLALRKQLKLVAQLSLISVTGYIKINVVGQKILFFFEKKQRRWNNIFSNYHLEMIIYVLASVCNL